MMSERLTVSAAEYNADCCPSPSLSASIAHILCEQSPLHAWTAHPKLNPDYVSEETGHFDVGTAAHALLLEGEWVAEVLDFPDWRTNKAKEARDAARAAGKVPILAKQWADVRAMVEAANIQLSKHKHVFEAPGAAEQTITWVEPNGIHCRARLDWLPDSLKYIDDYKTTGITANPEVISRTLFNNGWDIQAAFYLRAVQMLEPKADPQFRFVVQETSPPYALSVIGLGPDVLMLAEKKILWAIDKWGECLQSGIWPGYPLDVCYAELPAWQESRWLNKELSDVV